MRASKSEVAAAFVALHNDVDTDRLTDSTRYRSNEDCRQFVFEHEFLPLFKSTFPSCQPPTLDLFRKVSKQDQFSDVKKAGQHAHAKCNQCGVLKAMRKMWVTKSGSVASKHYQKTVFLLLQHKRLHQNERQAHFHRVFQARWSPEQICFITHDATLAFPIPRFSRRQFSNMNRAHKLELGVNGLTNFSANMGNYFYHYKHKFSKNCDIVITEWYLHLRAIKMSQLPVAKAQLLVLELDNCVGDNKNIYVFAFLSMLVYLFNSFIFFYFSLYMFVSSIYIII